MPEPVQIEIQPGPTAQPQHQVIDRRVRQRMPGRPGPQIDEHVIRIKVPVLAVQVVRIQADDLRADRHGALLARLGPGLVVVDRGTTVTERPAAAMSS